MLEQVEDPFERCDLRHGRAGQAGPLSLAAHKFVVALSTEWYHGRCGETDRFTGRHLGYRRPFSLNPVPTEAPILPNNLDACHALCPRNRGRIPRLTAGRSRARKNVCSKNEQDWPVVCNDVGAGLDPAGHPLRKTILTKAAVEPAADPWSERQNPGRHCT